MEMGLGRNGGGGGVSGTPRPGNGKPDPVAPTDRSIGTRVHGRDFVTYLPTRLPLRHTYIHTWTHDKTLFPFLSTGATGTAYLTERLSGSRAEYKPPLSCSTVYY